MSGVVKKDMHFQYSSVKLWKNPPLPEFLVFLGELDIYV